MPVSVNSLFIPGGKFFLIAGPCVLESTELHCVVARELLHVSKQLEIPVIFKASFDKANRRSGTSPRGPGLEHGLRLFRELKEEMPDVPVLTDIHEPEQAEMVAEVCDVLQVPANLCRQTDLLQAAAATHLPLNLKKGQWVGVSEMQGAVAKVRKLRESPVVVTERGTFFGYGDLVVDMRNIPRLQRELRVPVVFDGTHSVQRPAQGRRGRSGGDRSCIAVLVRAAVAAGANGLFLEVHPRPEAAPSDAESMLPLDELMPLMRDVMAIREALYQ